MNESILVKMGLDNRAFKRGLAGAQNSVKSMQSAVSKLMGAFAAGAAIGRVLKMADDLKTAADGIGATVERLQELTYAAEQSGVRAEEATKAYAKFTSAVSEARSGSGVLKQIFDQLNIQLYDLQGNARDSDRLFMEFADAIQKTQNPADRLRLAVKAFGEDVGPKMVAMLKDGSKGLEKFAAEAKAAGLVIDGDSIAALDRLDKRMKAMRTSALNSAGRALASMGVLIERAGMFWGAIAGGATAKEAVDIIDEIEVAMLKRLSTVADIAIKESRSVELLKAQLKIMNDLIEAKRKLRGESTEAVKLTRKELKESTSKELKPQRQMLAAAEALRNRALTVSRFRPRVNGLRGAEQARRELVAAARIEAGITSLKESEKPMFKEIRAENAASSAAHSMGVPSRMQAMIAAGAQIAQQKELAEMKQIQQESLLVLKQINGKALQTIFVETK